MDEILKVDHLKASYGNETILKDISFGVRKGEIRMVLGSSGCGKSTLLNNVLKFIKSDAGTGPNDLVAVVISDKSGKRFGIIRIITDVAFVLTGFFLGGKFGIGTLICAFLVGPVAERCMRFSGALVEKSLKTVKSDNV